MTLTPGETIGAYQVIEQIGRGGMATVFKAHQPALSRYVAIKVLPAYLAEDPGFRERFQAEAVTIAKLRHPNILQVFDYGEHHGLHYLVSEFVDGGTLSDQIGKPLPVDYVVKVLTPIASALDYAHAREVVHRDVKPSNVLLARDGTPVVSDFGLARMMGSVARLTQTGAVVGTPEYMAPEQAAGENAGPAADRYALAIVAYEMLVGAVPYSADTPLATLIAHLHKPLPLPTARNPLITPAVESVLLKGLAKAPEDRYDTAAAFLRALEAADHGIAAAGVAGASALSPAAVTATAAAKSGSVATAPAARRLPVPLIAAAGLAALAVVAAIAFATTRPGEPATASPAATAASTSGVPKGQLIWQATFDETLNDFEVNQHRDLAATVVRKRSGALEVESLSIRGGVSAVSRRTLPSAFVLEIEAAVRAASDMKLWIMARIDPKAQKRHVLAVTTANELMELALVDDAGQGSYEVKSARQAVPGLLGGRTVKYAIAVTPAGYAVFIDDGPQVVAAADTLLGEVVSPIGFEIFGERGQVTISGVRAYTYTGDAGSAPIARPTGTTTAVAGPTDSPGSSCTPAEGGTSVTRECRFTGLPAGATASFTISRDGESMGGPPGGQTVEADGSIVFRMQPGITGRFVITATSGNVAKRASFVAR